MLITSNENHHDAAQTKATEELAKEIASRYNLKDYFINWFTACPFIQFKKDGVVIFEAGYMLERFSGYSLSKCIKPQYYVNILTNAKKEQLFYEIDKLLKTKTTKTITQMSIFDI